MFWTEDINELFKPILIPTEYMTIEEKFNSITRLVLFICIILALVFQDSRIILLMIILIIIIIIIYQFQKQSTRDAYKVLESNDVKVVDNEVCTKPSIHNPFMNPNIVNLNQYKACPITDRKTIEEAEKLFDDTMFRNVDDVYDKKRQRSLEEEGWNFLRYIDKKFKLSAYPSINLGLNLFNSWLSLSSVLSVSSKAGMNFRRSSSASSRSLKI
jgi:hypothetical protein